MTLPTYTQSDLLDELRSAGATVNSPGSIECPFHDDKHPSANVFQDQVDGRWRFKCHTCGDKAMDLWEVRQRSTGQTYGEIAAEAGGPPSFRPGAQPQPQPRVYAMARDAVAVLEGRLGKRDATWTYHNAGGEPVGVVLRWDKADGKKDIRPVARNSEGWFIGGMPDPRPLYRLPEAAQADEVVVCEGEKAADIVSGLGFTATTSAHGSQSAGQTDWTPLAGKSVILWPDNDEGGARYAAAVERLLFSLTPCPTVRLVDVGALRLPPKGDAEEYIESLADDRADAQRMAVADVLGDARPTRGRGLSDWYDAVERGEYKTLKTGLPQLDYLSSSLMAGTVMVICGSGGSGKSFFMVQLAVRFARTGTPMSLYVMEDPLWVHQKRMLAQLACDPRQDDPEWVDANLAKARACHDVHVDALESVSRHWEQGPTSPPSYAKILDWIETKARAGAEVIGVDPVTAMAMADRPWAADQDFLMRAKSIVREHNTRLILVTHPRGGTKKPSMDALAGGQAYNRFPHTILWLQFMPRLEQAELDDGGTVDINRKIHIEKARNGRGQGLTIGCVFKGGSSLAFEEKGVLAQ